MWQNGKRCYISIPNVISCSSFPSSRVYRACLQRTSVFSLLTGALLEAIAALGARSALPYPFPQGTGHNSHAVLKGAEKVLFICVFDLVQGTRKEGGDKRQVQQGHHVFDSEKKSLSLLPCGPPFFPCAPFPRVFFFCFVLIHSGFFGSVGHICNWRR